jgi:Ni/Fe-hydrogenase subunit HybB-like protein
VLTERSLRIDERLGYFITLIGIPSAFLLHGYVGFIFGSVKANPWWSSPLMPIVFIFSAMVSGIAAVMLLYMLSSRLRGKQIDIRCLDKIAQYLMYTFIIDFSLEMLDLLQRIYEADESFRSLDFMVHTRLWTSQVIVQILLGTVTPIALLGLTQLFSFTESVRKRIYALAGSLTVIGIFAMRWNVVIGGQLFSKLPRLHQLQDGFCHQRRPAYRNHTDDSSLHNSLDPGQTPAALDGCGIHLRPRSNSGARS